MDRGICFTFNELTPIEAEGAKRVTYTYRELGPSKKVSRKVEVNVIFEWEYEEDEEDEEEKEEKKDA
jgi:hypothetical protein